MGTRCLTVFKDSKEKEIVVMYRQMDGYPNGHGGELADFLKGKHLVDGIGAGDESKMFNGMGCLAAQVIAHFKKKVGSFYLYPADTRNCGEDYTYIVSGKTGEEPTIKVEDEGFNGKASEYQTWLDSINDD